MCVFAEARSGRVGGCITVSVRVCVYVHRATRARGDPDRRQNGNKKLDAAGREVPPVDFKQVEEREVE